MASVGWEGLFAGRSRMLIVPPPLQAPGERRWEVFSPLARGR